MQADAYVVANGVGAQALCRQAGLQPLIYPLKGYSLTYALGPDSARRTSLSDVHNKVVYARLGDRLRVAGMVDIGDRDAGIDGGRIHQLKEQVRRYLPRLAPAGEPEAWAGLRPARPDGKPLIGRTPVRGCGSTPATARWASRWPRAAPACWPTASPDGHRPYPIRFSSGSREQHNQRHKGNDMKQTRRLRQGAGALCWPWRRRWRRPRKVRRRRSRP